MGLLKRLLREQKDGGLLKRAVTLKNYELESGEGKKKEQPPAPPKSSPTRKKE